MRTIPDTTGPNSGSEASSKDRDLTNAFTGKDEYQEIIVKAQSYPLAKLFKKYNIRIDDYNRKSICPFSFHKGGRESTASFHFFPETNTFWCYGCKSGRTSVDFVSKIENINKFQAALKIIQKIDPDTLNAQVIEYKNDFEEKNKLYFLFSNKMRDLLAQNSKNLDQLEKIYSIFDKMNNKYELEPKALQLLIDRLTNKINDTFNLK